MTDAGVDFLAVASRVAQSRFPLREQEISNLDVAVRERWLNDILDGIEDGREFNKYNTARLLLKAHALTECRFGAAKRYLNSIFTKTGEIKPGVREELGGILEGESLVDQALMMIRLRGEVRLAAEYLCDMVTGYDYTLRTEARMLQPGQVNLDFGYQVMMDQFNQFCVSETGENLLPDPLVRRFRKIFEDDVIEMLSRSDAEFYDPTSSGFIMAFEQWRESANNSWEITRDQRAMLFISLRADIGNGSGHPEALFNRYIAARDFIYQETSASSPEDQIDTKVSVRMLLLKELELCVVSSLIEASWTEERENLAKYLADRRRKIIADKDYDDPSSRIYVQVQSVENAIQIFWDRFGDNIENPASGCIFNREELSQILVSRYGPLFTEEVNEIITNLNINLEPDDDEE